MQRRITAFLAAAVSALALTSCWLGMRPAPDDSAGARRWLVVPVFFATNRLAAGSSSGIDFLEEPSYAGLAFGVKNVMVPLPDSLAVDLDVMKRMGWAAVPALQVRDGFARPPMPQSALLPDRKLTGSEIVRELDGYRKRSGQAESVIFVHGCCATFGTSLERAAKVACHMQLPVIVYDWVSPRGFKRYLENETRMEQTLDPFSDFLARVDELLPSGDLTLIGHSMGARLVDYALVRRADRLQCPGKIGRFKEVVLSNGDVDARTYVEHAGRITRNAAITRLYVSRDDDRLQASALAHGGFPRLGQPEDLLPLIVRVRDQEVIDITDAGTGHEIPFSVMASMHRAGKVEGLLGLKAERQGRGLLVLRAPGAAAAGAAAAGAQAH